MRSTARDDRQRPPVDETRTSGHRWDRVHDVDVFSICSGPDPATTGGATGHDVVLLHGLGMSNRYLEPSLRELAVARRVFAPDLPGVGRSSRASRELSMAEFADGLRDWMDVVGVGPAVVVGHSLSCHVAAHLAARHPSRVVAVVLASPGRDPAHRSRWQQAWWLFVDGFRERPSMVGIAFRDYTRIGARRMLRTLRRASRDDAPSLRQIRQPTLVVYGDRDPLVSPDHAERLVRDLPEASLAVIPGGPHGIPYSTTEPFVQALRLFLDGVEAPRPA